MYSDGFDTREEAERHADDLADAQFVVIAIQEGPYPTAAQKLASELAHQRVNEDTVRQRLRRGELRGPKVFGPPHHWPR